MIMRVSGVRVFFFKKRTVGGSHASVAQVCTPSMQPSEAYIKEGRGSGPDLATHRHDVLTVLVATPAGNAFLTSSRHAPLSAVPLHSEGCHTDYVRRTIQ